MKNIEVYDCPKDGTAAYVKQADGTMAGMSKDTVEVCHEVVYNIANENDYLTSNNPEFWGDLIGHVTPEGYVPLDVTPEEDTSTTLEVFMEEGDDYSVYILQPNGTCAILWPDNVTDPAKAPWTYKSVMGGDLSTVSWCDYFTLVGYLTASGYTKVAS